jgi:hypothetical protein
MKKQCCKNKPTESNIPNNMFDSKKVLTEEYIKLIPKLKPSDNRLFNIFNSISLNQIDICECPGIRQKIIKTLYNYINKSK